MLTERTAQFVIEDDAALRATVKTFSSLSNDISATAFNKGKPLSAIDLHRKVFKNIKGKLNSQMTCSVIRMVKAAYVAARKNGHKAEAPFRWTNPRALFLVGDKGRDASFRKDGRISIWTVEGRKKLNFTVPRYFQGKFSKENVGSITVKLVNGKLIGYVAYSVEVPDAAGVHPVGIDLNETNAIVAVDDEGRELFISGLTRRVLNTRTRKTVKRLRTKLDAKKAGDTHSIRRVLERLSHRRNNRTKDFCHVAAKKLVEWAPDNCVLVFEDLKRMKVKKKGKGSKPKFLNRRLSQWPRGMIRRYAAMKVEGKGITAEVDAYKTSVLHSRCGLEGVRNRHVFTCPHCQVTLHADINAALNIRNRYTAFRSRGASSTAPEARSDGQASLLVGG